MPHADILYPTRDSAERAAFEYYGRHWLLLVEITPTAAGYVIEDLVTTQDA